MSGPTDPRHILLQVLEHQVQQQQQLAMQQQQLAARLPPRPPRPQPPQRFGPAVASQGLGLGVPPQAAEAARARAAEQQMAAEDAWKACNPDTKTPFASVEDAVSRLLPYHVFADYNSDEDDGQIAAGETKSRMQLWDDAVEAKAEELCREFEKQVLVFNIMARKRAEGKAGAEERLMLESALLEDERRAFDLTRSALLEEQRQQEAAARMRAAMAQAQAAGRWPMLQPGGQQHAAACGEGSSSGQQQQQEEVAARMRAAMAQAQAQAAGGWPLVQPGGPQHAVAAATRSEGSSFGQQQEEVAARMRGAMAQARGVGSSSGQQQQEAAGGMVQWWGSIQRKE